MEDVGTSAANAIAEPAIQMQPRPESHPDPAERRAERKLVFRARAGSSEALDELLARHWDQACRTATLIAGDPIAAEDVAQEAMLAAIKGLPRFDARRRFGPWLHRITVNKALDHLRAAKRRPQTAELPAELLGQTGSPAEADPELTGALSSLEPEDRAIVVLRHVLDYRSPEIGEMLGLPAGTVRRRLSDAVAELGSQIGSGGDDE
jgi:RNA polymerase sigma-70 factor (ECF subfamily)